MRISKLTLLAGMGSLACQAFAADQPDPRVGISRMPARPGVLPHVNFPTATSQASWHEVCLKYNETTKLLESSRYTRGVCAMTMNLKWNQDYTKIISKSCPQGSIRALVEKPIARCIQPIIL